MTLHKTLLYAGVVLVVVYICLIAFRYFPEFNISLVFSDKSALQVLWENYKKDYVDNSGRTLDQQQGNITTSEGQSYTLLRAVWMDDKATYDRVLVWTVTNLQHKNDKLFSWLYGDIGNGTQGILTTRGGDNSATDADTDIALSLVFAYNRWKDVGYLNMAKPIINDIWNNEIILVQGSPYVVANNIEKKSTDKVIINPSYFAPYAYRIFSKIDTEHGWLSVANTAYRVLNEASSLPLDKNNSAHLPPDWITLSRQQGTIQQTDVSNLTTNFGFDALRVVWRVSLDYEWFKDVRAKAYLDSLGFLGNEWRSKGKIFSVYGHDGSVVDSSEAPAMYGSTIGYFKESDMSQASRVFRKKLQSYFSLDTNSFEASLGYYDSNWVWFGWALYTGLLPNLSE